MRADRFRLSARNGTYGETDLMLDDFERFSCDLSLNDEGRWQLTGLPADHPAAATLAYTSQTRGCQGVVLRLDGTPIMSGRVVDYRAYEGPSGQLVDVVLGIDDTARLSAAYVSPEPASLPPYQVESHDVRTGPSETLMHQYVSANVGPTALAERRDFILPGLATDGGSGRGTTVTKRARLNPLLDWLRELSDLDGLVFEVVQSDTVAGQLDFKTRMPDDRTGLVVFSPGHQTVSETTRTEYSARGNYILGAAGGEGTDRLFAVREDADSIARHGKWEVVRDQRGAANLTELGADIAKDLADGLGGYEIAVSPLDVGGAEFGKDYRLGDRVTVVVLGVEVAGIVSAVSIEIGANEATVTPTITTVGGPARGAPRSNGMSRVSARLQRLEANSESPISAQMVMHWAGALEDIPFGWILADGTAGTPNVLGRMIVGAGGTYDLGATGGAATANLQHGHTITAASLAHGHSILKTALAHDHSILASALAHDHSILAAAIAHGHSILASAFTHKHGVAGTSLAHGHTSPSHAHSQSHSHGVTGTHSHPMPHTHAIDHDHPSFNSGGENTFASAFSTYPAAVTNVSHNHPIDVPALTGTSGGVSTANTTAASSGTTDTDTNPVGGTVATINSGTPGDIDTNNDTPSAPIAVPSGQPATNPSTQSGQPVSNPSTQSGQPATDPSTQSGQPASDVTSGNALSTSQSILPPYIALYPICRIAA